MTERNMRFNMKKVEAEAWIMGNSRQPRKHIYFIEFCSFMIERCNTFKTDNLLCSRSGKVYFWKNSVCLVLIVERDQKIKSANLSNLCKNKCNYKYDIRMGGGGNEMEAGFQ